eukprot:UC4_evm1s94
MTMYANGKRHRPRVVIAYLANPRQGFIHGEPFGFLGQAYQTAMLSASSPKVKGDPKTYDAFRAPGSMRWQFLQDGELKLIDEEASCEIQQAHDLYHHHGGPKVAALSSDFYGRSRHYQVSFSEGKPGHADQINNQTSTIIELTRGPGPEVEAGAGPAQIQEDK